jgi:hypothetical protein
LRLPRFGGAAHAIKSISTIGLDIAKSVFQVHGVDAAGQVVIRRQLRRRHVLAFFQKLPPMPGRDRGVRLIAPLVLRATGVGAYGAIDASGLCEALRQAAKNPSRDVSHRLSASGCKGILKGAGGVVSTITTLCIAAYGFLISERETIPPSGPRRAALFPQLAVPDGYRPRGSAFAA